MKEGELLQAVQSAVTALGVDDEIRAAGIFEPRGHSGSLFAGGLIGGDVGQDVGGSLGGGIGVAVGSLGAQKAHDAATGLPPWMYVGVSDSTVYGFAADRPHHKATGLVFNVGRQGLEVKVHGRINVRVLELIHSDTGSRVELEGSRLPGQHAGDVIDVLEH